MVTLHQLRILAQVARHRTFTKAAGELRISQPSVSRQLKLLEEALGARLYTKSNIGIELTEKGQLCLNYARVILSQVQKLGENFDIKLAQPGAESLTVGGTYTHSAVFLPPLLTTFNRTHPTVDVTLRTGNALAIEEMILKGEIDIAVAGSLPQSPRLEAESLRPEKLVAFASPTHPLTKRRRVLVSDIGGTPIIIRKGGIANGLLRELQSQGFKPNIAMRCDSPEAVKAVVKKKFGVGLLFRDAVESDIRKGDFKIIKLQGLKLEGHSYIIYPKESPLSAHARDFLALLRQRRNKSQK
ncbi:MAG: LysR family transcriptional regulator [Deltaproteobacteria bacterium]|nr:LysR family transcriptional regulator [Deltaproteobacteria bacterium]